MATTVTMTASCSRARPLPPWDTFATGGARSSDSPARNTLVGPISPSRFGGVLLVTKETLDVWESAISVAVEIGLEFSTMASW